MIVVLACILLWFVLGALWRRTFGGWLSLPRWLVYAASVPLSAAPVAIAATSSGLPWWTCAGTALNVAVLILLFFVRGFVSGPIDRPTQAQIWKKYGPFGVSYWAAWRWWPATWRAGGFIDGENAVGELGLGGAVYGTMAAVCGTIILLVR